MAYADALNTRDRSKSIAGVVAVHAGVVGLLMVGLTVTVVPTPKPDDDGLVVTPIKPPPPPIVDPPVQRPKDPPKPPDVFAPPRPVDPPNTPPITGTVPDPGPITPPDPGPVGPIAGTGTGSGTSIAKPLPTPTPLFDPIAAAPRNDPGSWLRDRDYKSTWIRQEMTGTARFTLGINTKGRVTDCTITRSTGHGALDAATCRLISKRARFEPARDSDGLVTSGSYSSSIKWVLPD